jgi:hypothetical protein
VQDRELDAVLGAVALELRPLPVDTQHVVLEQLPDQGLPVGGVRLAGDERVEQACGVRAYPLLALSETESGASFAVDELGLVLPLQRRQRRRHPAHRTENVDRLVVSGGEDQLPRLGWDGEERLESVLE